MRFGTWNVRGLCRSGSLTAIATEFARCKLDCVGVQEVRWEKGGTARAEDYYYYYFVEKEKKISWEQNILYTTE